VCDPEKRHSTKDGWILGDIHPDTSTKENIDPPCSQKPKDGIIFFSLRRLFSSFPAAANTIQFLTD